MIAADELTRELAILGRVDHPLLTTQDLLEEFAAALEPQMA